MGREGLWCPIEAVRRRRNLTQRAPVRTIRAPHRGTKRMIQLVFAALGGLVLGAAITHAVGAQKRPPAYFIAESVVTNPEGDRAVIAKLPATAQPYGGKYLVR